MNTELFKFMLKYEGAALDSHTINATHLANALLGLSSALDAINSSSNPDSVRMDLKIHALQQGSFGIEFVLQQDFMGQIASIFTGQTATAIVNAYALVHAFIDVCQLAKWIRGRSIDKVEPDTKAGTTTITIDGQSFQTQTTIYNYYQNTSINQSINQFFSPLSNEGIERVSFIEEQETVTFSREDASYICTEQPEHVLMEDTQKRVLTILTASFKDGSKWRVSLGDGSTFHAIISDTEFLNRVDSGEELFAKHDIIVVDLKTKQSLVAGNLKTTYEITKVYEHKHMPEQLSLLY